MITQITAAEPKTKGVTVPTTADYVEIVLQNARRGYLEVINLSANDIEIALGATVPDAADFIPLGELGSWSASNDDFFTGMYSIKLWLKAAQISSAVVVY